MKERTNKIIRKKITFHWLVGKTVPRHEVAEVGHHFQLGPFVETLKDK